ncbi:hypothetical protein LS64_000505 [Helicobacter saguini]|uniref:Glycosyltransferase RgtA/B/C/D-like domain-containing protein n=1 Tax=Helicobacter saguini TaxID=1548018 RepID=A0A347W1C1_9HELI|nr:hypothetical protein [Helicobacter saguini]TLD95881.1 hypothetical protein LS64_000505 [Helicobacter saguini]
MSRFERNLLWFWSGLFALVAGLFFILSFLSRDRIYEANLDYKDSSNINDFVRYEAKIKFKNQIFRAQKDLSDIEITDFKFADSNVNFKADSKEVTNVTSKTNALESNNNGGGGGVKPLDSKNIESNLQDSNNLQNLDSIESNNLSPAYRPINDIDSKDSTKYNQMPAHRPSLNTESNSQTPPQSPFLEKDSNNQTPTFNTDSKNQTPIESNKFKNYQIYNFTHPNNQNFITFIMPKDSIKPTQITYKTHFKLSFLTMILSIYLGAILLYLLAKKIENSNRILTNAALLMLLIAVILRSFEYIFYRDLWLDEAALTYSMYDTPFRDLFFKPLTQGQAAPVGFLVLSKIIGYPFHYNEYSLYFLPFISGLFVLFLTYKIAFLDSIKSSFFTPFFIVLVCGSYALLYYSTSFKQYECEAAAAFLLVYLFLANKSFKTFIIATIFCSLFSYTSLFIAFGLGFGYLYRAIFQANLKQDSNTFIESNLQDSKDVTNVTSKDSKDVTFVTSKQNALNNDITESNLRDFQTDFKNSQNLDSIESNNLSPTHHPINHTKNALNFFKQNALYIAILLAFVIAYYLLYIRYQATQYFYDFWANYFLPHNLSAYPKFIKDNWISVYSGFNAFGNLGSTLYLILNIFGYIFLWKNKRALCVGLLAIVATYIALSWFKIYPFGYGGVLGSRLSLYMSVVFFILAAFGGVFFYQRKNTRNICSAFLIFIIFVPTFQMSKHAFKREYTHHNVRELIQNIDSNSKIFVYVPARPVFDYYSYQLSKSPKYETFSKFNQTDSMQDMIFLRDKFMELKKKDSKVKVSIFVCEGNDNLHIKIPNLAKEFDKNPIITQTKGAFVITFFV